MAKAQDGRELQRANLLLAATLVAAGRQSAVRIRDLSESGARIEGANLPAPGNPAIIERGPLKASGIVRWRTAGRAGLQFDQPIDVASWSPSAAQSIRGQADVDKSIVIARAGLALIDDDMAAGSAEFLGSRIAEELCCVARTLDHAGETMARDPAMLARHAGLLQEFDLAAKLLVELAALVALDDPAQGLDSLKLGNLRRRLTRSSL